MRGGKEVEIALVALSQRYEADDPRWGQQVADLQADLVKQTGGRRRDGPPAPGDKGAVGDMIFTLGTSGAMVSFLTCLRTWLTRDPSRSVQITPNEDATEPIDVNADTLDQLAGELAKRLGIDLPS